VFRYFRIEEFNCQETGENKMKEEFIHKLDELRKACGFPFRITSGYRSPNHSIEKRKSKAGTHAQGIACDIAVSGGAQRYKIVSEAMRLGFTGVGVAKTFIHVDIRETTPVVWEY
jgi:zinc D-Ala-D-Ala carboxypeptidase